MLRLSSAIWSKDGRKKISLFLNIVEQFDQFFWFFFILSACLFRLFLNLFPRNLHLRQSVSVFSMDHCTLLHTDGFVEFNFFPKTLYSHRLTCLNSDVSAYLKKAFRESSELSSSGKTKGVILSNCRFERKSITSPVEECKEWQHRMVLSDTLSSNLPGLVFTEELGGCNDFEQFWTRDARLARQF